MYASFSCRLPDEEGMRPAYEVEWKDAWEPFYIGRRTVPRYDERFKQVSSSAVMPVIMRVFPQFARRLLQYKSLDAVCREVFVAQSKHFLPGRHESVLIESNACRLR